MSATLVILHKNPSDIFASVKTNSKLIMHLLPVTDVGDHGLVGSPLPVMDHQHTRVTSQQPTLQHSLAEKRLKIFVNDNYYSHSPHRHPRPPIVDDQVKGDIELRSKVDVGPELILIAVPVSPLVVGLVVGHNVETHLGVKHHLLDQRLYLDTPPSENSSRNVTCDLFLFLTCHARH